MALFKPHKWLLPPAGSANDLEKAFRTLHKSLDSQREAWQLVKYQRKWEELVRKPGFNICHLDYQGMEIPIQWAKAEGWNPGLDDRRSFYAADPDGFLSGWLDERIIANIKSRGGSVISSVLTFVISKLKHLSYHLCVHKFLT